MKMNELIIVQNGQRIFMLFILACTLLILLQQNSLQLENSSHQPFHDNSTDRVFLAESNNTNSSHTSLDITEERKFVVNVQSQPDKSSQSLSSSSSKSSPSSLSPSSSSPSSSPSSVLSPSSPSSSPSSVLQSKPISKPSNHHRARHHPLWKFPLYNGPKNVSRVLLLTYFRSGSSFMGDIMQQNWKTFYSFEPLMYLSLGHKLSQNDTSHGVEVVEKIFNCDFETIDEAYMKKFESAKFLLNWNKFLYSVCRYDTSQCKSRTFLAETCRRSRYNLMKTTRLTMDHAEMLWKSLKDKNFHVVFLVRDPRGILNSRSKRDFCIESKGCTDIVQICDEMRYDLKKYEEMKPIMGDNLIMFKYEDMTAHGTSNEAIKALMKSVKLPYSSSVARFVKTHSNAGADHSEINNPYSTFRTNATLVASQWMTQLNRSDILRAQDVCGDVLKRLNYVILN